MSWSSVILNLQMTPGKRRYYFDRYFNNRYCNTQEIYI
jgi:hypothetical protein